MTVIMNNSEVAENLLKLHSLRAKINVKNMLKHMHLSPRSKEGRAAKKIFGNWVALGWLTGGEEDLYDLFPRENAEIGGVDFQAEMSELDLTNPRVPVTPSEEFSDLPRQKSCYRWL